MKDDMTVPCADGFVNIRVGAVIMKNGRILMAGNKLVDYLYSVGGRVKFGETAMEAIEREVYEETGVRLKADRLGFVHENYFRGDMHYNLDKLIYEISFYYYMEVPEDFEPVCTSFTDGGGEEFLVWIDPHEDRKFYPEFFRTELSQDRSVKHIITDEREIHKQITNSAL